MCERGSKRVKIKTFFAAYPCNLEPLPCIYDVTFICNFDLMYSMNLTFQLLLRANNCRGIYYKNNTMVVGEGEGMNTGEKLQPNQVNVLKCIVWGYNLNLQC